MCGHMCVCVCVGVMNTGFDERKLRQKSESKTHWMSLLSFLASNEKRYDIKSLEYQKMIKEYNLGINRTVYQWWDYIHGLPMQNHKNNVIPSNLGYDFNICDKVMSREMEQIAVPKNFFS